MYLFDNVFVHISDLLFSWVICFLIVEVKGSFYILDTHPLPDMYFRNISLSVVYLHSFNRVFHKAEVLNFNKVYVINFFFHRSTCFNQMHKIFKIMNL